MKKRPSNTSSQSAHTHGHFIPEQARLFSNDELPIKVTWPNPDTWPEKVLRLLLAGNHLTQPQMGFDSWRLGAHINVLKKMGFPIVSMPVANPNGGRCIAEYFFSAADIAVLRASRGRGDYGG
ncbi:hypothetical protein K4H28_01805 [Deefgea tanakiae]|uniref:Uncharacterized protein n=1 Tax=Deefgea tanakiae TaxID=2865840 RepID=A0ABX8Z8S8_9NEIS|nr:hypothetical protein [Deefgea tanakiae]QZA78185.1 hypothetical protein K4H28_01805 [Deefgea tanakiae]